MPTIPQLITMARLNAELLPDFEPGSLIWQVLAINIAKISFAVWAMRCQALKGR